MGLKRILLFSLCLLFAVTMKATPAAAQDPVKLRVQLAIIDIAAIERNAAAMKDIRAQLNNYRVAFGAEIQKEDESIRVADQELARQRTILSPEAFQAEREKFMQRVQAARSEAAAVKDQMLEAERQARLEVRKALNEVILGLAQETNLNFILRADQVVFWAKSLDITETVLERLDKKLPSVKVQEPGK